MRATLANLAGAHIVLGTIGAGLALTPIGWTLLGASAVAGGALAWWQRRGEVEKFQKEMQEKVKKEFQKLLEPEKVLNLKEQVGKLFDPFQNLAKSIGNDVQSLEDSLNNLLQSKRKTEVNCQAEGERLQTLSSNIDVQFQIIQAKYEEIERKIK